MKFRSLFVVAILLGVVAPARAQFAVIDPSNLVQNITQVQQAINQINLWRQIAAPLPGMGGYATPTLLERKPVKLVLTDLGIAGDVAALPNEIRWQIDDLKQTDGRIGSWLAESSRLAAFTASVIQTTQSVINAITHPRGADGMGAGIDKLTAASVIAAAQDRARNDIAMASLELQMQQAVRQRDAEARALKVRINMLKPTPEIDQFIVGRPGESTQDYWTVR